ncbi:mitochondrial ribosomal [Moniliophthora roreri]|nr:mitochondrial ribosomal [Moniliophthora roreri]
MFMTRGSSSRAWASRKYLSSCENSPSDLTTSMLPNLFKWSARSMATAANAAPKPYPFSKTAIIHPERHSPPPAPLVQGKGLMAYLRQNLPTPEKQALLRNLFSKHSPNRLYAGSVINVTMDHAPFQFTGVILSIRRRGPDTSFVHQATPKTTKGKDEKGQVILFEGFPGEDECVGQWEEDVDDFCLLVYHARAERFDFRPISSFSDKTLYIFTRMPRDWAQLWSFKLCGSCARDGGR